MTTIAIPRHVHTVIFDCDGVLIDSWEAGLHFFNSIRQAVGLGPLTPEQERDCFVRTIPESLELIIPETLQEDARQAWESFPMDAILERVRAQPGIAALLDRLHDAGRGIAVCTNGGAEQHTILEHLGLRNRFDLIVTAEDAPRGKPWPDGARSILRHFDIQPDRALFVGDSHVDEDTARNAEIPFWAYRNPALNAVVHVDDFSNILIV